MKRNGNGNGNGKARTTQQIRCAIYTRKSTEEGLEQEFNSLDAQRESAEAYVASQQHEGWACLSDRYDDGGFTGANMERPALKRLFEDIEAGRIDCVVVYKVDRLSRSLLDFARMIGTFEKCRVSFVSVTQQFNTTHSMGRLTLNILLSFAQFEREIISERTRDKIAAVRRKGKWAGGMPVLGYDVDPHGSKLVVNAEEAERVRAIFAEYLQRQSLIQTAQVLNERGWKTKRWTTHKGHERGGKPFDKNILLRLLTNVVYLGKVRYKDEVHAGEHEAIVDDDLWQRAQRMLRVNGRTGGMHIRNKYGALLKGLVHCKPCGCAMMHTYTSKDNRRYRYYVCGTAQKQGWHACPSKSLPAEEIERFVVDQIRAIGKDPAIMGMALEQARAQQEEQVAGLEADARIVERDVGRLHVEIAKAAAAAATNGHAAVRLAELHEQLREAEQRLTELRDDLARARRQMVSKREVDSALEAFTPLWDTLSPREQARVLRLLVKRVDYDGANGKVAVTFHANGIRALGQDDLADSLEMDECPTA
ncbi:MAG: cassette chromosome recombinase B [Phycisphaerae bacterium]|nr:MAG: recombinase family protein [Planctomycetia bacterium]GJQ27741.1 MAG: cassette chromosome recombinase B [Phycisphaerae bacterium]